MKLKKWDIEKIYIENSYFMIKKNPSKHIFIIFLVFYIIIAITFYIVRGIMKKYLINEYYFWIGWSFYWISIFSYSITLLYCFLSKEFLEINKNTLLIKKNFIFLCYYTKQIKLEDIVEVRYKNDENIYFSIITRNLFFKGLCNIILQIKTEDKEDEEIYFGIDISKKYYIDLFNFLKKLKKESKIQNIN